MGVGKSTQCRLIKNYLQETYKRNSFQIFTADVSDPESIFNLNKSIESFLKSKDTNIAILDATIASAVVISDLKQNNFNWSIEKFDTEVKSYLNLLHGYASINCLISPKDVDFIEKRTGLSKVYLTTFLKGFEYFEQSQIASNLNYLKIEITEADKIIPVFEKIRKELNL